MILSNVNIGTGASAGNGDPLRTAFTKINDNFAQVKSNVDALSNSVTSVAGRSGNVTLTVNDIIGFNGVSLSGSVPTYSNSSGVKGQLVVSANVLYLCIAANTWIKTSVTSIF
jgi:hypothetical protein